MKKIVLPIFIILGILILTLVFIDSDESTPSSSTPTKVSEVNSESSDQESDTSSEESEFKVGDVIKVGDRTLTVVSVEKNWKGTNSYMKPDAGNQYVVVRVAIENTGKDTINVNDWSFEIQDASGVRKNTSYIGVDDDLPSVDLIPNGKVSGNLGFEVKSDATALKLVYKTNMWTDNVVLINLD